MYVVNILVKMAKYSFLKVFFIIILPQFGHHLFYIFDCLLYSPYWRIVFYNVLQIQENWSSTYITFLSYYNTTLYVLLSGRLRL